MSSFSVSGGRAHPRSRGEHSAAPKPSHPVNGSSPLARGARSRRSEPLHKSGLIPARAGSTQRGSSGLSSARAHPRSRGEHPCSSRITQKRDGSSPLARGARGREQRASRRSGLIPARAGSTPAPSCAETPRRAHPRSRGEHMLLCRSCFGTRGSSPLARGAPSALENCETSARLIPARAGSTRLRWGSVSGARAHPRSRGEHLFLAPQYAPRRGSSPLARGAHHGRVRQSGTDRLIPARAGSTQAVFLYYVPSWAHPRSRGEHLLAAAVEAHRKGSSPLARGAPRAAVHERRSAGLIPARAGSTLHDMQL